jgi:hypothetical protein
MSILFTLWSCFFDITLDQEYSASLLHLPQMAGLLTYPVPSQTSISPTHFVRPTLTTLARWPCRITDLSSAIKFRLRWHYPGLLLAQGGPQVGCMYMFERKVQLHSSLQSNTKAHKLLSIVLQSSALKVQADVVMNACLGSVLRLLNRSSQSIQNPGRQRCTEYVRNEHWGILAYSRVTRWTSDL